MEPTGKGVLRLNETGQVHQQLSALFNVPSLEACPHLNPLQPQSMFILSAHSLQNNGGNLCWLCRGAGTHSGGFCGALPGERASHWDLQQAMEG